MKRCYFVLVFSLIAWSAFAQSTPTKDKAKSNIEISLQFALPNYEGLSFLDKQFRSLVPTFPSSDSLSSFENRNEFSYYNPIVNSFRMGCLFPKFKTHPRLSLSVSMNFGIGGSLFQEQSWETQSVFTYDTIVSQNTGEKFPLDSTVITGYNRMLSAQWYSAGAGFHLIQTLSKRFSLQYGVVAMFQIHQRSLLSTAHYRTGWSNFNTSNSETAPQSTYITLENAFKMHSTLFSLPIELRFQCSVKSNFWQKVALGVSFQPFLNLIEQDKQFDRSISGTMGGSVSIHL